MPPETREWTPRSAAARVGLALTWLICATSHASDVTQPVEPLDITGRDFAGLRLPVSPAAMSELSASFAAARSWAWTEPPQRDADGTLLPPVQRLLLSGDVTMTLGIHELTAARALVWFRPLRPGDVDGVDGLMQVYVYFDRVGTPTASPDDTGPISFNADRLSVEGVFELSGPDILRTDQLNPGPPPPDRFMLEGEQSLARRLRRLIADLPEPSPIGTLRAPPGADPALPSEPGLSRPYPSRSEDDVLAQIRAMDANLPLPEPLAPIFAEEGVFTFTVGHAEQLEGDPDAADATVVMITGGLVVQYHDVTTDQELLIRADRAIVYLTPSSQPGLQRLTAREVLGIYVEGDAMATDGQYTLRAPRMYYDVQFGRALVMDAVFWTYDDNLRMPMYVRAKTLRQESSEQFKATGATISNTAFFEPHFSIGASSITIARNERNESGWTADARHITLKAGAVPFFYWPIFKGDPRNIPLRAIELIGSSVSGGGIRTAWDIPTLLGISDTRGVSAQLLLDAYFERGLGLGSTIRWTKLESVGGATLYMLPNDTGTDSLSGGGRKEHDGDFRGMALLEHQWQISDTWSLFLEGSVISDETFIDAFFPALGSNRREFRNSAYVRWLDANSTFTAQAKASVNDFTPNEHLLQSQGYVVDRLPEVTYSRVGDDLLASASPGLLTYFSESRLGTVGFNFTDRTPADFGFTSPNKSQSAFGLQPDENIGDSLRADGLNEDFVTRFDTRHELTMPLESGIFNVTPYAVGRFTAYSQDFESYSGNDEQARVWGETGVRVATTMQRIDDSVRSRVLDVNRVRHIITPSVTGSIAGTTLPSEDLPVYDDSVEALNDGGTLAFRLEQTWQTKRGGPGRERSVDWITVDTELVLNSEDENLSPYPRYFGFRNELSKPGDFVGINGTWQVSEVFGLTGSTAYDFNTSQQTRTAAGLVLRHSDEFVAFADLLYSNPHDSTFLSGGVAYKLSDKYDLGTRATYDQQEGTLQNINAIVTRRFPNISLGLGVSFNNIRDETSFSFSIQPEGLGRRGANITGLGSSNERQQRSTFGG